MKRILITGGAGFIGSHTADALLAKGFQVRVLDCLDQQIHGIERKRPAYLDPRVELFIGDVRLRGDVIRALDGIDAVYHFAAQTGVGQSMYDIHSYCDVNISGTAMLLDVLANTEHRVGKIILSSSRAVYGEGTYRCDACGIVFPPTRSREQLVNHCWEIGCPTCGKPLSPLPTDEEKPLSPISIYALTKQVQEDLVRTFSSTYRLPSVILRYFNVYGTRQAINNPYTGIGAIFANRALSGQDIHIYEDGKPGRDFVNVRDVVQANVCALENDRAENGTFNVGSGERLTVLDLATLITKKLKSRSKLEFNGQFRMGDIRDCYADLTKSREILGYRPTVTFAEGIEELIAWARGEVLEDRFMEAESALRTRNLM
ncbi:MAG: NAD-dependent dehydratase [Geobacter sp.]|nr:MAG: NAD-dependent dehydratase [Geobacter sp.]